MNNALILTIGSELLKGSVLNSNAQYLARMLTSLGFNVQEQISCDDTRVAIVESLQDALKKANVIIMTGGLGPTPDDVTRDAIADFLNVPLELSAPQYKQIEKHYRRFGRVVPNMVRKEAMFPKQSIPLVNRYGIALGFYFWFEAQLVVVLPGVPVEMIKMFEELVSPLLQKSFPKASPKFRAVIKTVGISEPTVMKRLGKGLFAGDFFDFGIYPDTGEVTLRYYAAKQKTMARLLSLSKRALAKDIYAFEEISLSEVVGKILQKKKRTLAVAESCTGGQLSSEITRIPGASRYFYGSVVAYDNRLKRQIVKVPPQILTAKGAVSSDVAKSMAQSIREMAKVDYGLAITGIAGPDGGSPSKPVGTVYIALSDLRITQVSRFEFWGDRNQIQAKAAKKALELLWRKIR